MKDEDESPAETPPEKALYKTAGGFYFSRAYRWSIQVDFRPEQQPKFGSSSSSSCGQIPGQALPRSEATGVSL